MDTIKIEDLHKLFYYYACPSRYLWEQVISKAGSIDPWDAAIMIYKSRRASYNLKCEMLEDLTIKYENDAFVKELNTILRSIRSTMSTFFDNEEMKYIYKLTRPDGSDIPRRQNMYSMDANTLRYVAMGSSNERDFAISKVSIQVDDKKKNDDSIVMTGYFKDKTLHHIVSTGDGNAIYRPKWIDKMYGFPVYTSNGKIVRNVVTNKIGLIKSHPDFISYSLHLLNCTVEYDANGVPVPNENSKNTVTVYYINTSNMRAELYDEDPVELEPVDYSISPDSYREKQMIELLEAMKIISGNNMELDLITRAFRILARNFNLGES